MLLLVSADHDRRDQGRHPGRDPQQSQLRFSLLGPEDGRPLNSQQKAWLSLKHIKGWKGVGRRRAEGCYFRQQLEKRGLRDAAAEWIWSKKKQITKLNVQKDRLFWRIQWLFNLRFLFPEIQVCIFPLSLVRNLCILLIKFLLSFLCN